MTIQACTQPGSRLYCTYFDSVFLARGIAMLRSLQRHDPAARIMVLALDDLCARVLRDLFANGLRIIEAEVLLAFSPALREIRDLRSAWAYYATQKPALAQFAMEIEPRLGAVMYIDADTWFFGDPSPIFDEIGTASLGLSPHRFHTSLQHLAIYGLYNAGCIYWRNDETSRRCLADWHDDCLEWCAEQVQPDGRFMNQGYLNSWPDRYPRVHIVQHPGLNLAPWNIDRHLLSAGSKRITVDGEPLIFYHFSGVSQGPDGQWYSHYPRFERQFDFACEAIYCPYIRALEAESVWLRIAYGIKGTGTVRAMSEWPSIVPLRPHDCGATR